MRPHALRTVSAARPVWVVPISLSGAFFDRQPARRGADIHPDPGQPQPGRTAAAGGQGGDLFRYRAAFLVMGWQLCAEFLWYQPRRAARRRRLGCGEPGLGDAE